MKSKELYESNKLKYVRFRERDNAKRVSRHNVKQELKQCWT